MFYKFRVKFGLLAPAAKFYQVDNRWTIGRIFGFRYKKSPTLEAHSTFKANTTFLSTACNLLLKNRIL